MKHSILFGLLAACCSTALTAQDWSFDMSRTGGGTLAFKNKNIMNVKPGYFTIGWNSGSFGYDTKGKDPAVVRTASKRKDVTMNMLAQVSTNSKGNTVLEYTLSPDQEIQLNSIHVSFTFEAPYLATKTYSYNNRETLTWPANFHDVRLSGNRDTTSVQLNTPDGPIQLNFDAPVPVMAQDNRQWSGGFELRVGPQLPEGTWWPAGKPFKTTVEIVAPGKTQFISSGQYTIKPGKEWITLDTRLNVKPGSAIDFSSFNFADGPAGKYGHVKAKGPYFVFENKPDTPQRFYGVNFCFTAHDLTHEQSEELAERLWRLGYNTVRYHHHERDLQDLKSGSSTALKPDKLDRFDYLHYALTKRGIYVTTDTFVSRTVFAKDVFPGAEGNLSMNEIKMLLPVSDKMFENWKEFCRIFLGHKNKYTGKSLAQDPALAWISLVNEGNFGNYYGGLEQRTRDLWIKAWNEWSIKKYGDAKARNQAWNVTDDYVVKSLANGSGTSEMQRDFDRFECELEINMIRKMTRFLREELGSKALITDMNCWTNPLWTQIARTELDYVDDHFYVDHPSFLDKPWRLPSSCNNTSPVKTGTPGGGHTAFTRLFGKPFTITEYNFSGPGRYRGVGGIMLGCLAALQDWAGIWRFAYSHGKGNIFKPANAGYFDLVSDPLNQCAERATLCLYLRGDMQPAERKIAITMPDSYLKRNDFRLDTGLSTPWQKLNVIAQVGHFVGKSGSTVDADVAVPYSPDAPTAKITLDSSPKAHETTDVLLNLFKKNNWLPETNMTSMKDAITQSPDEQLTINGKRDVLVLNTKRTAGGFAPAGETIHTDVAEISIFETDATVWISSLSSQDIPNAKRLLISHLTDLQNTNAVFANKRRTVTLSWGSTPHLVRNGQATVTLKMPKSAKLTVYRIATDGERLSTLPVKQVNDGFQLDLNVDGPHGAQLMYEVVVE